MFKISPASNSVAVIAVPHMKACACSGISQGSSQPNRSSGIQSIIATRNIVQLIASGLLHRVFHITSAKKYTAPPQVQRSIDNTGLCHFVIIYYDSIQLFDSCTSLYLDFFGLLVSYKCSYSFVNCKC